MKWLQSPIVKTVLTIVAVIVALNILRPYTQKIPVVGQYI